MNEQFKKNLLGTANAQYINKLNSIKVLDLVRNGVGISRADIAKKSRLSAPTVSRIVESLIDGGLVEEAGIGISTGGRRQTFIGTMWMFWERWLPSIISLLFSIM